MHEVSRLSKGHIHYSLVTVVNWQYDLYKVKDVM